MCIPGTCGRGNVSTKPSKVGAGFAMFGCCTLLLQELSKLTARSNEMLRASTFACECQLLADDAGATGNTMSCRSARNYGGNPAVTAESLWRTWIREGWRRAGTTSSWTRLPRKRRRLKRGWGRCGTGKRTSGMQRLRRAQMKSLRPHEIGMSAGSTGARLAMLARGYHLSIGVLACAQQLPAISEALSKLFVERVRNMCQKDDASLC